MDLNSIFSRDVNFSESQFVSNMPSFTKVTAPVCSETTNTIASDS